MRAPLRALAVLAAAAVLVTGCGSGDDWSQPHAKPSPVGTLGPGFVDSAARPTPEGTVTPRPGSWSGVHPSKDYRVVLLTTGDDSPTKALVTAVRDWAEDEEVDLRTVVAKDAQDLVPSIVRAIGMGPDLIVSAGNDLVDPLALVTASHLSQQFLVVGAELAEPTHNVTAVDWSGASFRGEGLGASSTYDAGSFTAERCAAAIRAGVAAVLNDLTGIVVWLD
ncbi:type 1 periplasmic-binding domain-containing protein [Plantactinospora sonchi]|uniref:BMP family ABC transporter substrate-binding protein n=1 Tax=Plantactinospora sonchi TaxID=1544735 RepID=A0ABU7RQ92_9ACTN